MPVLLLLAVPFTLEANVFQLISGIFNDESDVLSATAEENVSAQSISLLSTVQNPYSTDIGGGDISYSTEDGVLLSTGPVAADAIREANKAKVGEISVYTVRPGDTLSQIAEMYDVSVNTILWANDLPRSSSVKVGQTLVILPVAGLQHTVKKGETLASIVKKYEADLEEVLEYNQLADATDMIVGEELIIPGGTIKTAPKVVASTGGSVSGGGWLSHPLPGAVRSQGIHGYNAVDFARVPIGTTVRAAAGGTVIVSKSGGYNGGYGSYVVIKHSNGVQTLYAHLNTVDVSVGEYLSQGERIGGVGNTGRSTGPHLHFEVRGGSNPF